MLNVPILDDLSYRQIFEQARSLIPGLTQEWTDFNYSDPGIAILQTFAWLADNLNFYMDSTGDAHRLKYMKLLGIRPEEAPAHCVLALNGHRGKINLPKGAKFAAGDVMFETEHSYSGNVNEIRRVYREAGGEFTDLTRFAGQDGDYAQILAEEGEMLYLGFASALSGETVFYVEVSSAMARNAFARDFFLAELEWEYYDGARWRQALTVSDETGGLLRSGRIRLYLEETTGALENPLMDRAHYLRCRVAAGGFDVPPQLGRVVVNCAKVCQTDTKAQALEYSYQGEALTLDYPVSDQDFLTVAVESGGEYTTWYEFEAGKESLCAVEQGEYHWQRVLRFDRNRFGIAPEQGSKVLVVVVSAELAGENILGITDGCVRQRYDLPLNNVCELRVALTTRRNGRTIYRICEEQDFELDRANGQIVFGDGIQGLQPERGMTVEIITLKTSLLDRGNVRRGTVNHVLSEQPEELGAYNLDDAVGGHRCETMKELEQRIEEKMSAVTRAVNRTDYQRIVMETPGLLIGSVNVISMKEYRAVYPQTRERPNAVILAVKPRTGEARPVLGETYRRLILKNLEPYRLLTTCVQVVPARYVAVSAYGRILLRENSESARTTVEKAIRSMVEAREDAFGRDVICGRIFSMLELLEGVRKVARFSLEYEGEGAQKNDRGDIMIFPDSIAYVADFGIEYI